MVVLFFIGLIFFIYGATCLLSIIFTFSIDLYRRIEEKAHLEIFSEPIINPLFASNINWFDAWIQEKHKIIGPIFILLSAIDLHFWFRFINLI